MSVCPICASEPDRDFWRGRGRGGITSVQRCSRCHAGYADPMPDAVVLQAHYGAEYFERHYGGDRRVSMARCVALLEAAEHRLGGHAGRLLDVGCGVGDLVVAARERGWSAVGIEASADAARRATERGCAVVRGDAPALLKAAHVMTEQNAAADLQGPFDLIVFHDVLGHLSRAGEALIGAVSRLQPGGWLFIRTPNRHAAVYRMARRIGWLRDASGILHLPAQVLHLDRDALGRIFADLGLVDSSVEGASESAGGMAVRYSANPLANWFWHRCIARWERSGTAETLCAWARQP